MSQFAPRVTAIKVPVDKIGEVIGPKGKMINSITEQTGADISIEDDGTIYVGAADGPSAEAAIGMINAIANPQLPKIGERFLGTVVKTAAFGAFVSLVPGKDGLVHISKLGNGKRIGKVEDVVKVGDKIRVEVTDIDNRGKISLVPVRGGRRRRRDRPTGDRRRDPVAGRGHRPRSPRVVTDVADAGGGGIASAPGGVSRTELPGGLRVLTEAVPGVRSVSLGHLDRHRLARRDAASRPGPRTTSSTCCSRAPRRRTAAEIAEEFDAVGGELNAFTAKEHTCYYAHVLDTDLPLAVDVLADVVTDAAAGARPTSRWSAGWCSRRSRCATTTPRTCSASCSTRRCSATTRSGRPVIGSEESIRGMSRDDAARVLARRVHHPADGRRRGRQPGARRASSSWSATALGRGRARRAGGAAPVPPAPAGVRRARRPARGWCCAPTTPSRRT